MVGWGALIRCATIGLSAGSHLLRRHRARRREPGSGEGSDPLDSQRDSAPIRRSRHRPHPRHLAPAGLVDLATTLPTPRKNKPLPATIRYTDMTVTASGGATARLERCRIPVHVAATRPYREFSHQRISGSPYAHVIKGWKGAGAAKRYSDTARSPHSSPTWVDPFGSRQGDRHKRDPCMHCNPDRAGAPPIDPTVRWAGAFRMDAPRSAGFQNAHGCVQSGGRSRSAGAVHSYLPCCRHHPPVDPALAAQTR